MSQMHLFGSKPEKVSIMSNPLIRKDKDQQLPLVLAVGKKLGFCVRIPEYDTKDDVQNKILEKYLSWGITMLGYKPDDIKVIRDSRLGQGLALPVKLEKSLDRLMISMSSLAEEPEGYKFRTGIVANLPETIALLKVIRENSLKVRRQEKAKKPLTSQIVRDNIDVRMSLKDRNTPAWGKTFTKLVLNEMTRPATQRMPGEWLHSLKARNKKSSKAGILALCGYTPKAVPYTKVQFLLKDRITSEVITDQKKNKSEQSKSSPPRLVMKNINKDNFPEGRTFKEYRFALTSAMPYIDPKSSKKIRDQVLCDPMDLKAFHAGVFFNKNRRFANAINLAYATKATLNSKGSKSTLKGLENNLQRCLRLSAHVPYEDAAGQTYERLSDIPKEIRDAIAKSIGYEKPTDGFVDSKSGKNIKPSKKVEEGDSSDGEPEEEDESSGSEDSEDEKDNN